MEGEYVDNMGQKHQISETRALSMLDRHEFIFSDLSAEERTSSFQDEVTYGPLLAAWVSRADDVVARLASIANKKAGGLGASGSDEDCIKVCRGWVIADLNTPGKKTGGKFGLKGDHSPNTMHLGNQADAHK
jgi:hypothetical protein